MREFFLDTTESIPKMGGYCLWQDRLLIASPKENILLSVDIYDLSVIRMSFPIENFTGCAHMLVDGESVWILSRHECKVYRWHPRTNFLQIYANLPSDFTIDEIGILSRVGQHPFSSAACDDDFVFIAPFNGNMYLRLDKKTGIIEKWDVPFSVPTLGDDINDFQKFLGCGCFFYMGRSDEYLYVHTADAKLYRFFAKDNVFQEIALNFNKKELEGLVSGFRVSTNKSPYACFEDPFNSLASILSGSISGVPFCKEEQKKYYESISDNLDGSCGKKVYEFFSEH